MTPGHGLDAYLCDAHQAWLGEPDPGSWRERDASLLFLDISGFTPLTERLARRGKAGVEQLIDILNGVLAPLVSTAGALGGDTLKFGGDALLIEFSGSRHAERACAAAWDLQAAMAPYRRLRTSAGIVELRASAGIASGPVHTFLAGDRFGELVLAGPTTSAVMGLESAAEAGEILIGASTAAALDPAIVGAARADGALLAGRPLVEVPVLPATALGDPCAGLPAGLHDHLGPDAESEHRLVVVAFAQFRGLDELLARSGPAAAAAEIDALVARVQRACDDHGVTFLDTDADRNAGKFFLVAGAPTASTDDEDRMLHALREIVAHEGELRVRAGVNRGRAFAVHLGAPHRRTYTTMGDTTNLAARVMGKAPDGRVLATHAVLQHVRAPWSLEPVAPFAVKGKKAKVDAQLVGPLQELVARPVVESTLAGREAELAVMRHTLSRAQEGTPRIVELVGEPGIGKSRLVAEISAEAEQEGVTCYVVEAGAYGTATPYFALRAPLRAVIGAAGAGDEELTRRLTEVVREHQPTTEPLLPLLAIPFGLELPATEASAQLAARFSREQLHFLVDRLLGHLLPAETLVVIEDAHWLDEASSELIRTIMRSAPGRGWAALVTRRPGEEGLTGLPNAVMRIELEPLDEAAARALVSEGGGALPPHVTKALVERANGNPLFLRELVAAARAGELEQLPDTVEALITARMDTLPPAQRRLLRRAAVLGQRFPLCWLSGMLDMDEDELRGELVWLEDFLAVEPDRVRFRHALQRDAAYETLPFERRRQLHARAGGLIERLLGDQAEDSADILGLHFLRAQEYERAWRYNRAAADRARERFAYADAAQLYRRAIEAARPLALERGEQADLWEALGDACTRTGELSLAEGAFTRARRLVAGDPLREAALMQRHADAADVAGHLHRVVRWVKRALRLLEGHAGQAVASRRAELLAMLATVRQRAGRADEAIELCRTAIAEAEAARADRALAHAYYVLDSALTMAGRIEEAQYSERALEIYRRLGDPRREAGVLNNLGTFAYRMGRWDDAVALYRHASQVSQKAGSVADVAFGDYNIGELRSDQGRYEEGRARLIGALQTWRATGDDYGVALVQAQLGRLEARVGDHGPAIAMLELALAGFRELKVSADAVWVEALIPEAHALCGHAERALRSADQRVSELNGGGYLAPLLQRARGLALAQLGELGAAAAALDASLQEAREIGEPLDIVLGIDALLAVTALGGAIDHRLRRERDDLVTRLDITRMSPALVGSELGLAPAAVAAVGA